MDAAERKIKVGKFSLTNVSGQDDPVRIGISLNFWDYCDRGNFLLLEAETLFGSLYRTHIFLER
ncbi:MAG: hypothetical protein CMJ46_10490 [Planctomyces sp.]|nr:hypothetical protein [Planctomyces sp.]